MHDSYQSEDELSEASLLSKDGLLERNESWRRDKEVDSRTAIRVFWIAHIFIFLLSITFFCLGYKYRIKTNETCSENWLPMMSELAPTNTVRFEGGLGHPSPFTGTPSKALDDAWDRIAPLHLLSIPEDLFQSLNASKYSAESPVGSRGDRLALFEGIHQLHCLKSLWMTTHPEYYAYDVEWAQEGNGEWREHIDHCTDILRQKIMCDADTSMITYNWVKNHYSPHPNFNVQHQCRDYNRLLELAEQYKLEENLLKGRWILRPTDKVVVDFVEPPFDPLAEI